MLVRYFLFPAKCDSRFQVYSIKFCLKKQQCGRTTCLHHNYKYWNKKRLCRMQKVSSFLEWGLGARERTLGVLSLNAGSGPPRVMPLLSLQCYMFHMYVGVRAGGGIGDEIEDPAGDEYEIYRIIFDITFFFFVIVILLAIIQGKHHPHGCPRRPRIWATYWWCSH